MFYVYVLKSRKNSKTYTGSTKNLGKRLLEHNTGKDKRRFGCANGPWDLMFFENFKTRSDAMRREKFLKSGKGREYIKGKSK